METLSKKKVESDFNVDLTDYNYIVTDHDGDVCVFSDLPIKYEKTKVWVKPSHTGKWKCIAKVDPGGDWENSIKKLV